MNDALYERAFHQLTETQSAILNALPAHVALLDPSGTILVVNESWRRYATANALGIKGFGEGLSYLQTCEPASGECRDEGYAAAAGIRRVLRGETAAFTLEYTCHSPTEQRWFQVTATPVCEDRRAGAVVMHIDVTERRLAELAARRSEKRLRDLIDGLGPAMFVGLLTPLGVLIECNQPALAAAGLTPDDVLGRPFDETYWWAHSREAQQQLCDAISRARCGEAARYDVRLRVGPTAFIDVDFSLRPLRGDTGEVTYLVASANDITERKRVTDALRKQQELLAAVFDNVADDIVSCDAAGVMTLFNRSTRAAPGTPGQPASPEGWAEAYHLYLPDGRTLMTSEQVPLLRALREGAVRDVEMVIAPPGGRPRRVVANGRAFFDAAGTKLGAMVALRDVTERQRDADRLQRQQTELRVLFDLMPAMIWFKDTANGILRVNQRVAESAGKPVAEIEGRSAAEVYPDDAARFYADDLEVIRSGVPKLGYVETIRGAEGEERWVQTDKVPYRDPDGTVIGIVVMAQDVTERKHAEQALRESEERFAGAFEHAPIGVALAGPGGRFLKVNRALCELVGYSEAELLDRTAHDITHPEDFAISTAMIQRVMASDHGQSFQMEKRYVHARGHIVVALLSVSLVRDAAGQPLYMISQIQDITRRKEADATIRFDEQRYRVLVEETAAIVWDTPASGELKGDQPRWTAFTGQSFEECQGWGWLDAIHPEDRAAAAARWTAAVANHGVYESEYRLRAADHSYRNVTVRAVAIRDENGAILRWVGVHTDVTEHKRAAQALRTSTEEFRVLTEAMPQIVWIAGPDGQTVYINQHWADYTGLPLQVGLGGGWIEPFHPDDKPRAWQAWQDAVTSGGMLSIEVRVRRADGEYRWWLIRGVPQWNAAGEVLKWFGTCTDIQDLKLAELEITRTNVALQEEIAERRRAEVAAEAANHAKSEFLANMSHEIRTPLNGVIGMTELVLDTVLTVEQRNYLAMVKMSGESLLTVINDILDFSKVEAGELVLEAAPFNLNECLSATLGMLAPRAHLKGLELACDIRPEVPVALIGDRVRLGQIVTNLVGNAVKFTDRGEVVLTVHAQSVTDRQAVLRFTVADTGIGVAPQQQAEIFKPFIQADGSTTRNYGGTGLGLSISTRLVALLGGRIQLESEVGKGSRFHFTVSIERQQSAVPEPRTRHAQMLHLRDLPVMVVDDNAVNRGILEATLQRWRMKPVMAVDGASALAALREHASLGAAAPLVVLDAHMPGMDGFSVAAAINEDPALAGATILMLTSAARPGDAARCEALGIRAFLNKPVSQIDLLEAILVVLGVRSDDDGRGVVVTDVSLRETRRKLRILIAEDNPVNQLVAARLLGKRGHAVVVAGNGKEALAALDQPGAAFDLILMDVQMPEMDGFETTAAIRAREQRSGEHLPIIAMTAHAMKGDEERCLAAGMDAYVSKPIQVDAVVATIESVLA